MTDVVRGEGSAPGQGPGEAMPTVPKVEPARAGDFARIMREKNAGGPSAPAGKPAEPPRAGGRIGDFQSRLEGRQEAPTQPGQPRDKPAERDDREPPEQNQIADPTEQEPLEKPPEEPEDRSAAPAPEEPKESANDKDALARYRELEQSPMLPDELAAEKMREIKINGRTYYHTVKELEQMAMRGGDYRQKSVELQQAHKTMDGERQAWQQHWTDIRDPHAFLEVYERNGYTDTIEQAFWMWAERKESERSIIRAAGLDAMNRFRCNEHDQRVKDAMTRTQDGLSSARQVEIKQRQLEFREQQLRQQEQQRQSQATQEQYTQQYERQLNQLRPLAFRSAGIKDNPANRQALNRHLWVAIQQIPHPGFDGNITRDLVLQAAADLQEEIADQRTREQGLNGGAQMTPEQWQRAQRAAASKKALPPTRFGGGGGSPMSNGNGVKQGRLSDLEALVRRNRLGG